MRGTLIGALLAGGEDAALCHASALVPQRMRTSVVTIDVAVPTDRRDEDSLRFHRLILAEDEVTRRDGLRVTTIERTLFDIAATGADIRRLAHEAIAKRLTTPGEAPGVRRRHRGERGAPALRRVAGEPHTRGRHERRFLRFLAASNCHRHRRTPDRPVPADSTGRSSTWSSSSTRTATRPSSPSSRTGRATATSWASDCA